MTDSEPRAYIGSFTSSGGRGITLAAVDPATGALRVTGERTGLPDPSYLRLTPDRRTLCAVSESEDGAVAAFALDDPAEPRLTAPPLAVRGAAPTHMAVTEDRIYTANYASGTVSGVPLRDGRVPQGPVTVARHRGGGPVTSRQGEPHAHAAVLDPTGTWLLAVDLGTDSIWVYAIGSGADADGPRLELRREVPLRAGTGPRHLAFHPDGETAYVVHELDPVITRCRWNAADGTLEAMAETRLRPESEAGESYPSGLTVTPDGTRLYAAVRGHDSVAVLALGSGGAAEPLATVECGGQWPRDLSLTPDARRLYVANERSGDVTWFGLDPSDGVPRRGGSVPVPAAACVVFT